MNYYKISTADFAQIHEGDFELLRVLKGEVIVQSAGALNAPFEALVKLPEDLQNELNAQLENAREAKIAELNTARDEYIAQGVEYNGVIYDADERSQALLGNSVALYAAIGTVPEKVEWIRKDNGVSSLTYAQLVALGAALAKRVSEAYLTARTLKTQAENATALAEIQAIKWTLGENSAQNSENSTQNA